MSNVTLSIGGRSYTVACAKGEESHVLGLGTMIDRKLTATMGDLSGQAETRMLLFAALLLADELYEAGGTKSPAAPDSGLSNKLEQLASRLESLAARLES